jgi:hypothetical protein
MEKQRKKSEKVKKVVRKTTENEIDTLRKELERLRELKRKKELAELGTLKEASVNKKDESVKKEEIYKDNLKEIENRLNDIDKYLLRQFEQMDKSTYAENASYIEAQLQKLEEEIVGEVGIIENELSPYEKLLNQYPWLEQNRFSFMYTVPDQKKKPKDYESWKTEWAKVLFDYAKCAILHIIYLRELYSQKPFGIIK